MRVNRDEANIRLHQRAGPGILRGVARERKNVAESMAHRPKTGDFKGSFTRVSITCDNPDLQPLLPQHIFLHRNQILEVDYEVAQGAAARNVILRRSVRTGVTSDLMKIVLKSPADAIKAKETGRRILLSLDAFRAHFSQTVWRSAAAHGNDPRACPAGVVSSNGRHSCLRYVQGPPFQDVPRSGNQPRRRIADRVLAFASTEQHSAERPQP